MADAVTVYFVRHAKAGERELWSRPDHVRPLTKPGRRQAKGLVKLLKDAGIHRILSSAYVRCTQTVEPLADACGLEVEEHPALAEGAPRRAILKLITSAKAATVMCTHGDVMKGVIDHLADDGVEGADPSMCKKGATWVLEVAGGRVTQASYLPPPPSARGL